MGVILLDLANDNHKMVMNWWNWRPILALLRGAELIDEEQFELLGCNCGGELTQEQVLRVAAFLKFSVLPCMRHGDGLYLNGLISGFVRPTRPITECSTDELYVASREAIESVVTFCETSKGFRG